MATLRAHLAGDSEEYQRQIERRDPVAARTGYPALVGAAVFVAVDRQFSTKASKAEIIDFVRDLRARYDRDGDTIDPYALEQVILQVLGHDADAAYLDDDEMNARAQMQLLTALVYEAGYDDAQLDEFMAAARALAEKWTS